MTPTVSRSAGKHQRRHRRREGRRVGGAMKVVRHCGRAQGGDVTGGRGRGEYSATCATGRPTSLPVRVARRARSRRREPHRRRRGAPQGQRRGCRTTIAIVATTRLPISHRALAARRRRQFGHSSPHTAGDLRRRRDLRRVPPRRTVGPTARSGRARVTALERAVERAVRLAVGREGIPGLADEAAP